MFIPRFYASSAIYLLKYLDVSTWTYQHRTEICTMDTVRPSCWSFRQNCSARASAVQCAALWPASPALPLHHIWFLLQGAHKSPLGVPDFDDFLQLHYPSLSISIYVKCLLCGPAFQTQATVALPELWASLTPHGSLVLHPWGSPVVHAVLYAPCETAKKKQGWPFEKDKTTFSLLPRISWTFTHRVWPHNALVGWHPVGAEIIGKFWHCSCKCTCCLSTVWF